MKKLGAVAIALLLGACATRGDMQAQGPAITRYLCNGSPATESSQASNAPQEQYPCTKEEFESMNNVYGSLEELRKSL